MTDPQFNHKDLREQRLPIVSDCRLRYKMSFSKIAAEVNARCKQNVDKATIKRDWDYLVKQWREDAAVNTRDACDEELMTIDIMIAELSRLYEQSKQPLKKNHAEVKSAMTLKNSRGNPIIDQPLELPVPTDAKQTNVTEERIGDVRILSELRKWCERKDKLLGLNKINIDVTSGGQKFTGFAAVLPIVPNIEEIARSVDIARAQDDEE